MSERQEQYNAALERLADQPITKEQVADFHRQQMSAFVERFNAFLEAEDFTIIAVPFIDKDGKISARIEVTPK